MRLFLILVLLPAAALAQSCDSARETRSSCLESGSGELKAAEAAAAAAKAQCLTDAGCPPPAESCQRQAIQSHVQPLLSSCGVAEWAALSQTALAALGSERGTGDRELAKRACPNRTQRRTALRCMQAASGTLKEERSRLRPASKAAAKACERAYPAECKTEDDAERLASLETLCTCARGWEDTEAAEDALAACWTKESQVAELDRLTALLCVAADAERLRARLRDQAALKRRKDIDVTPYLQDQCQAGAGTGGGDNGDDGDGEDGGSGSGSGSGAPLELSEAKIMIVRARQLHVLDLSGDEVKVLRSGQHPGEQGFGFGGYANVRGEGGVGVRGLICGGSPSGGRHRYIVPECYYVDPSDLSVTPAPPIPHTLTFFPIVHDGSAAYAMGGADTNGFYGAGYRLADGADQWEILPNNMTTPRSSHAAATMGGRMWEVTGENSGGKSEVLDLATLQWSNAPEFFGLSSYGHSAVSDADTIYVCGGRYSSDCFSYRGSTLSRFPSMNFKRYYFGLIRIGRQLYAVGGGGYSDAGAGKSVERLDLDDVAKGWTLLSGDAPYALYGHATLGVA